MHSMSQGLLLIDSRPSNMVTAGAKNRPMRAPAINGVAGATDGGGGFMFSVMTSSQSHGPACLRSSTAEGNMGRRNCPTTWFPTARCSSEGTSPHRVLSRVCHEKSADLCCYDREQCDHLYGYSISTGTKLARNLTRLRHQKASRPPHPLCIFLSVQRTMCAVPVV